MSVKHNGKTIASNPKFHPDLLEFKWSDHLLNDPQWLRADTFSQQYKSVYGPAYDHLADDIVGKTLQSETVAGITIQFYLADDKHKICPVSEESNVTAIYNATGVAWYYIIDTTNQWFKLPRGKHNKYAATLGVVGNGMTVGITDGTKNGGLERDYTGNTGSILRFSEGTYGTQVGSAGTSAPDLGHKTLGITTDSTKSGIIAQQTQDTDQYKYLYFYVGNFTQTALENTAGITTEEMNNKVNIGHEVIEFQAPTAENNYTWYRKYADGWVEQGQSRIAAADQVVQITFPIEMADEYYVWSIGRHIYQVTPQNTNEAFVGITNRTTTGFGVADQWGHTYAWSWQVSGMAA